jgi:hypothetical protein
MKIAMRVIPRPQDGTREILSSKHPGSMAIKGSYGSRTFVCGRSRDILAKSVDPDWEFAAEYYPVTDSVIPLNRVRDVVFRCKNCGAFNEIESNDD